MRRLIALTVVVGAAVIALAAPGSGGAYPGQNGLVAFTRVTEGAAVSEHIWSADPATGETVQLTDDPDGLDQQPEWSPDGTKIAFARDTGTELVIVVMNADGTDVAPITDGDGDTCPTWSPDGMQIAYSDGPGNIVIIPSTGGAATVTLPVATCELSWSPLGDLIAFSRGNGIEVIAPVEGAVPQSVTTNVLDGFPTWAPDGSRIVFERDDSIVTVRPDGTDEVVLVPGDSFFEPAFSPDGTRLVLTSATDGSGFGRLVTVASGGGTPAPLTTPAVGELDAQGDWQPLPPPPPPPIPVPIAPTFTG